MKTSYTYSRTFLCSLLILASVSSLYAQNDVESATSNNREIMVLPAPGAVVIDGKDNDWDLSAGIWSYNNPTLVNKYSVWTHLMWDEKGVYLMMRYSDLSPMKNDTRGKDFDKSWRADAFQGRVVFDGKTPEEHQMHINGFYSSAENVPYLIVHHGGFKKQAPFDGTGPFRQDQLDKYGSTMDKFGGKIAFKTWEDGKGYNMETFWPWSYLRTSGQPLKAGDSFIIGVEAMWGNIDGSSMTHRLVDNLKDDKVNRIFFFRARDGWGQAVISAKGNLSITEEQKKLQADRLKQFVNYDTEGSIPITYSIPEDRDVTIAIDSAEGKRIRNLIGQFPRSKGKITDHWDGLDDAGKPVTPGSYTVQIVDHAPVQLKFFNSVYNAATPPWVTESGRKLWGSNHGHPTTAATRGDIILLGFTGTEGAPGLMRITSDAKILWTDNTELLDLTLTDKHVYLVSRESYTKRAMVRRMNVSDGTMALFENPERSTEIILPIDYKEVPDGSSIAYADGKIFALAPGKSLWRLEPNSGKIEATLDVSGLLAIENYNDTLWGLFSDGAIAKLSADGKRGEVAFTAKNLKKPVRFAISLDGKSYAISDQETNQVFVYDAKGKLSHTLGEAYAAVNGMRPAGKFIETDLIDPMGLAFDAKGDLWLAEAEGNCRRITRWTPDGKLSSQYWGGADYGAMEGFPITFDSTRFIAHGLEFKLDPAPDIHHKPTQEKPLIFHPELCRTRGLVYAYKGHEYAVTVPGQNKQTYVRIAKRNDQGVFKTVVHIQYGNPRGKNPIPGKVWTDLNDNGVEDSGETVEGFQGSTHYWSAGWMRPDMTFITPDQNIYPLKKLTAKGVPIYDFLKPERPKNAIESSLAAQGSTGTVVMDDAGNVSDGIKFATVDGQKGSYPNPFGRHDAPAARRGLLIAPFRTNGVIEKVPGVGSITALGGDRGEWFLMSMDGLFLSSILQDSKGEVTLDDTFVGQESFGGFIWRDEKGRILVQLGGPSYRLMELTGLETTRKETQKIKVTAEQIAEGVKLAEKKAASSGKEPETLMIAKVGKLPTTAIDPSTSSKDTLIDRADTVRVQEEGDPTRWFRVALAHNEKNLVVAYQVNDANPWKNGEGRFTHPFIGGDAVDIQLDIPGRGPIRLMAAPLNGENTVTYWQKKADKEENKTVYIVANNESNAQYFDVVKRLTSAKVEVATAQGKYTVLLTIPMADIGLDPAKVNEVKGLVGVIFSDPTGTNRASRLYWHNKSTGLVSDVPSEARLDPSKWGQIQIGK